MILRVLHYNPLSANQLRLEEILRATRHFSIVGLVATQRKALVGLEIGSSKQLACTIVEAGWARAPLRKNRLEYSSHCANPSPRNTYIRHVHHHHHCKVEHSRHVSKEGFFDLFVCCMYLPPRPQAASKRGGYQWTVERLLEWLDGCLSEQKHSTTPVVLMDANGGIDMELRAGRYHPVHCQCIAAAGARREHVAASV